MHYLPFESRSRHAALAALIIATAPLAAMAQNLPAGSYAQSCSNASVVDGTLIAQCRRMDQTLRNTSLPNAWQCQGSISNNDGKLECGSRGNAPAAPQTSDTMAGRSRISNQCRDGAIVYVSLRWRGSPDNDVRFLLEPGTSAKFDVPRGTSLAAECGRPPGPQSQYRYLNVGVANDLGAPRQMP